MQAPDGRLNRERRLTGPELALTGRHWDATPADRGWIVWPVPWVPPLRGISVCSVSKRQVPVPASGPRPTLPHRTGGCKSAPQIDLPREGRSVVTGKAAPYNRDYMPGYMGYLL